jgi:hypothetical protein
VVSYTTRLPMQKQAGRSCTGCNTDISDVSEGHTNVQTAVCVNNNMNTHLQEMKRLSSARKSSLSRRHLQSFHSFNDTIVSGLCAPEIQSARTVAHRKLQDLLNVLSTAFESCLDAITRPVQDCTEQVGINVSTFAKATDFSFQIAYDVQHPLDKIFFHTSVLTVILLLFHCPKHEANETTFGELINKWT